MKPLAPRASASLVYPPLNSPPAETHPGGAPTKFTPRVLKRILRCARRGLPLTLIAKGVGVSTMALRTYRLAHPRFELSLERSIARGADARLRKIEQAAEGADWRAAAWLLEHCQPEHFSKNRLEVSGPDGAPLTAAVAIFLPQKDGNGNGSPAVTLPALSERTEDGN